MWGVIITNSYLEGEKLSLGRVGGELNRLIENKCYKSLKKELNSLFDFKRYIESE